MSRTRLARLGRCVMAGLTLCLSACGGGGGEEAPPAPPAPTAVAGGQQATQAVGAGGGSVVLSTREGAVFTLTVPAGAVPEGTVLMLQTAAPATGRRLHLRLSPGGLLPSEPLVLTLSLPSSMALPAGAPLVYDRVPLPVTRLVDGRLELRLPALAMGTVAASGEARALAVRAQASPAPAAACQGVPALADAPDGGLADAAPVVSSDYGSCVLGAINALTASGQFAEAARLSLSIGAYLQSIGADNAGGLVTQLLTEARSLACTAYGQALDTAAATTVTSFGTLTRATKPVLFWEAAVQQLGAVCQGVPATRYVSVVENLTQDALRYYDSQQGAVVDVASEAYTQAVAEVRAAPAAVAQLRSLRAPAPVQALAQAQLQQQAQPAIVEAVLQAPWQRCRDSGNFDKLIELMEQANKPAAVKTAAQYCGTQLQAEARNAAGAVTATLSPSLGGVSAGTQRTSGSIDVAKDGTLILSGPIHALQCPAGSTGGSESLQVKLGSTVLQTITAAPYLANDLVINIAQALQAAGLNASSFTGATLTLSRSGSPCGGFWGDNPEPLLTLNLTSGLCAPRTGFEFCATALPVAVGAAQEPTLNDRGDLLLRASDRFSFAARGTTVATPLPAGLKASWGLLGFNARGDVLGYQDADPRLIAVWPAGGAEVVPLPLPALPAGFTSDANRTVGSAVLADDGSVTASVLFTEIFAAGSVPSGCVANTACLHHLVVRWQPPYAGAPQRLDGPWLNADPNANPITVAGVNAAGVAAGLRPAGVGGPAPALVRWTDSGATVVSTPAVPTAVAQIDDQGVVLYFVSDGGFDRGRLNSTGALNGVADPNQLLAANPAGYAVACSAGSPGLMDTRDGRRWSLNPATLVDPATGWTVDDLLLAPCSAAGPGFGLLRMNRQGHWLVRGSRSGSGTWMLLTPRGQPLP